MLKINIICVGDFKENYWREARDEYCKRLSKFFNVETIVLKEQGKEKECFNILQKINGFCILLDVLGCEMSSLDLASHIKEKMLSESKITFIIGGSDGVNEKVKNRVDKCISFGKITLPHQLARVVLLEQLYRAGTIINNIKYHK